MFHDMLACFSPDTDGMFLTICLFIGPDLDGHGAPKNGSFTLQDPQKGPNPKYEATALLHSHPMFHGY